MACSSDDGVPSSTDFDYSLDLLYGEWRATSIEAVGDKDLTTPINELYAAPTYLKFNKDGTVEGEGLFGEGTGKYSTNAKTIHTSIGKIKKNFNVTTLQGSTAKFKVNAKGIDTPLIPENTGEITVTLKKDYTRTDNFEYPIETLYGKWRAVTLEGALDKPHDLTNALATPTYLTFEEKGVLISEGYLAKGTGRYSTEDKTIYTLVNEKRLDFEVIELEDATARITFDPTDIDFGIPIPTSIKTVTLELKKQ